MQYVMKLPHRFVSWVEGLRITPIHLVFAFLFIGLFRAVLEQIALGGTETDIMAFLPIHAVSFYFATFFLFFSVLARLLPIPKKKLRNFIFVGLFLALVPPLLDILFFSSSLDFRAYSYFDSFALTFFDSSQSIGESVILWLTVGVTAAIAWLKTRRVAWAAVGGVVAYGLLQFLLFGSSVIGDGLIQSSGGFSDSNGYFSLVFLLIGFICMIAVYWDTFKATVKRAHHALVFGALVVVGAQFVTQSFALMTPLVLLEAGIFAFAFFLAQAENDFYDKDLDALTGRESKIGKDDLYFIRFLQIALILSAALVDISMVPFLLFFFVLSFGYSHHAIRLKRNCIGGSFTEGLLCLICLMTGIYSLDITNPVWNDASFVIAHGSVLWLFVLIAAGFALCSNLKDYKDFKGDLKGGITTLYVFLYTRWRIAPQTTNRILALALGGSLTTLVVVSHMLCPYGYSGAFWVLGACAAVPVLALAFLRQPRLCVSVTILTMIVFFLVYSLHFANRQQHAERFGDEYVFVEGV